MSVSRPMSSAQVKTTHDRLWTYVDAVRNENRTLRTENAYLCHVVAMLGQPVEQLIATLRVTWPEAADYVDELHAQGRV